MNLEYNLQEVQQMREGFQRNLNALKKVNEQMSKFQEARKAESIKYLAKADKYERKALKIEAKYGQTWLSRYYRLQELDYARLAVSYARMAGL